MGRRDFIQTGLGALGGLGLTQMLGMRASAASQSETRCIFIWLDGGPSHYETFDPKPDAPSEIRGEFKSIPTSVPGVHFSEKFPKLAKGFDKFTVVRSIAHAQNNHGAGNHYLMTGRPTPVPVGCGAFVTFHPSFGSVVSQNRAVKHGLPAYVSTPRMSRSGGPNFLGAQHAPFVISDNPDSKSFRVRDVTLPKELEDTRAKSRVELRKSLDQMRRITDTAAEDPAISFDDYYARAFDLVTSDEAQKAFDISHEPESVREKYGRNDFGQRLLLARRLTEVGVPFVTVYSGGWDDHRTLFENYKKDNNGTEPYNLNGYGYDGVMLVVDAIKRAGGTDKEKVREAMQATKGFQGVMGGVGTSYGFADGKRTGFDPNGMVVRVYQGDAIGKVVHTGQK